MTSNDIPTSTFASITHIARETGITKEVVEEILNCYARMIKNALRNELPFVLRGIGKIYFRYTRRPYISDKSSSDKSIQAERVHREVTFAPLDEMKGEFNGWVHNMGIENNHSRTLLKLKIRPDELSKLIKKRTLDDQRSLGFRSELLFDELPDAEKSVAGELGKSPSIEEIAIRIGKILRDD